MRVGIETGAATQDTTLAPHPEGPPQAGVSKGEARPAKNAHLMHIRSRGVFAPELSRNSSPSPNRGRREDRAPAGAHGPRATKSTRQNHRLSRDHPAFPARWCYDLYAIFPGNGCLAPVASDSSPPTWHQHRDARTTRLHRRTGFVRPHEQARAASQCAHRIPHPTSVTTAKRPLCGTGCGDKSMISD